MSERLRPTVKALVERDGRWLLLRQASNTHGGYVWTLPGGGVEFGERSREALRREVREETGLAVTVGDPVASYSFFWEDGDDTVQSVATVFAATPGDGDVDVDDNPADEPIVEGRWVAPTDLGELRLVPALADMFDRLDREVDG